LQTLTAIAALMLVLGCTTTPTAKESEAPTVIAEVARLQREHHFSDDDAFHLCIAKMVMKGYDQEPRDELFDRCVQRWGRDVSPYELLGYAEQLGKACDAGEMKACLDLGSFLSKRGDVALASTWYRRAAEHGDAEAQNALGVLYLEGAGIREDFAEALKWISKAAE
jgi:hypothetical protein